MNKEDLLKMAAEAGIKVDGRWSDEKIMSAIQSEGEKLASLEPVEIQAVDTTVDDMNAYALRIWEGQSPDLDLGDRVGRVKAGLERQGWTDFTKLDLPATDYERYL